MSVTEDLRDAEALAAEGRQLEAVALLQAANREVRDPDVELRLVDLRHRAFAELAPEPREPWPPDYPDLWPDLDGIPEIDASELTDEAVGAGILHHGSLLVRGMLRPERADQLREGIDLAFENHDRRRDGTPVTDTRPWFSPFQPLEQFSLTIGERWWTRNGGGVWTVDSPRALYDLIEAFEEVGLRDVLARYLGEPPVMSVKKCTLRRVPVDSGSDWHQDGAFLGDDIRTVNVWLTLTHCGDTAPGLDVVSKRLNGIVETGTDGAQFDWSVGPGAVERVAGGDVVRPIFEAGDALLFDQRNLHRTAVSEGMVNERYAIETWFFAPSTYPMDQIPIAF